MSKTRKTFLFVALPLLIIFGLIIWQVTTKQAPNSTDQTATPSTPANSESNTNTNKTTTSSVSCQQTATGWQAVGTPPACADPLNLPVPANLKLATSILYPGQYRGGNYKPHGGFRFNNSQNADITVTVPLAGNVVQAARYLVSGETQYMFDVMTDCGIMYRLGHLLTLAPKFATIVDTLPAAIEGDSRTEYINPPIAVTAGESMATAVGITVGGVNTFFDLGVYNYNTKNAASADSAWAAKHQDDTSLAPYAVCWFDLLATADEATVRALPAADPGSGKTSDYCK